MHEDPRVSDVRTYGAAFNTTELDHQIHSTPIPWQNNASLLLVAGKTLGGSGSINGASWTKGAASQYDILPLLTGDDSWGWDEFNPYMLKAEGFNTPELDKQVTKGADYEPTAHGFNGSVQVSFGAGMYGGTQVPALEASEKIWPGLTRNPDAASGRTTGGTIIPNMVHSDENQNRSSPFTTYAQHQVEERNNFVILTGHRVTEIVWESTSSDSTGAPLRAAGVHFQHSPTSPVQYVQAGREVLLAAGSLQSPQILELSGVGDPEVLSAAGIDVQLELSGVGKNVQEQTKNTVLYQPRAGIDFGNGTGPSSAIAFPSAHQLLGNSSAQSWFFDAISTVNSFSTLLTEQSLVSSNLSSTELILLAQIQNLFTTTDSAAAEAFFTVNSDYTQVGIDNWNLIVLSRGTAHIHSSDPWTHPVVNPHYFLHPLDLAFQIAINKASRAVFETAPLSDYVETEITPGYDVVPRGADDSVWEAWIKSSFTSVWHYVASCAMMKRELGGVVSSRLQVYGTQNVRVVDASVVPIQLSAHLSSSLYGVAEKAADMIREDWVEGN